MFKLIMIFILLLFTVCCSSLTKDKKPEPRLAVCGLASDHSEIYKVFICRLPDGTHYLYAPRGKLVNLGKSYTR